MADSFTSNLRLLLQQDQRNVNLWGNLINKGVIDLAEEAISGVASIDVTTGNVSIAIANANSDQQRPMFIEVTGDPGSSREIIVPSIDKIYIVINKTSPDFDIVIKTAANDGVTVSSGNPVFVWVDQTSDVVRAIGITGTTITAGSQFVEDTSSAWSNRTAGDTGITIRYSIQGKIVSVIIDSIDVTISNTLFDLTWGGGVPTAIIPGEATSPAREYPILVMENGVAVDAYIQIPPGNANWLIRRMDAAAWIATSTRVIPHKMTFNWETITD